MELNRISKSFVETYGLKVVDSVTLQSLIRIFWIEYEGEKMVLKPFLTVNEVDALCVLSWLPSNLSHRFSIPYDILTWKCFKFGFFEDCGSTLFDYYQHHVFELKQFKLWMREIMTSLSILKQHYFIHGDVKPTNICLFKGTFPTLIDFGLAEKYGTVKKSEKERKAFREYIYMAPELLESQFEIKDEKADVYGLGVTMLALLVPKATLKKRRHIQQVLEKVESVDCRDLIQRMTDKDPTRRPSWDLLFSEKWFQ